MTNYRQQSFMTQQACFIDVSDETRYDVSILEINMTESLLTPGLQTSIIAQSKLYDPAYVRNFNDFYAKDVTIKAEREVIKLFDSSAKYSFSTTQKVYRLSNRQRVNYGVEQFQLDACDQTLLQDGKSWVSQSWKATPPHMIVQEMLDRCVLARNSYVEQFSGPPRDYVAENIHPFQVINQQAEVALTTAMDPSFVHFMTYQDMYGMDIPTHNFRSLTTMASMPPMFEFTYSGKIGTDFNYASPYDIMHYEFPCDFDLLSDILNGHDEYGNEIFSLITWNPYNATASIYGRGLTPCGGTAASSVTNLGTAEEQSTVPTNVEQFLLKRKPRMSLLDQDKVAIRLTVAFNPGLNVGKMIRVNLHNPENGELLYGSGEYLIASMTHNLKTGGFGTTIMDCTSSTIMKGVV